MNIDGKYWLLIEEAPFDPRETTQIEIKAGVATWRDSRRWSGTCRVEDDTILIEAEMPATSRFAAGALTIHCSAMGHGDFSGYMTAELVPLSGADVIETSEYCLLMRVGGRSEKQALDAERDPGCDVPTAETLS